MKQPRVQPSGRAFTLLEVILASAIGSLVLIGALGVLFTLDRSDRLASARFDRVTESERVHKVLARAFSSLLMSSRPVARDNRAPDAEAAAAPAAPPPPARLVLSRDPSMTGVMLRRGENSQGGPGASVVQRIEMVLSRSPVPVRSRAEDVAYAQLRENEDSMFADNDEGSGADTGAMSKLSQSGSSISKAFRGAIELVPMATPGARMDTGTPLYSLWWRPLPSLGDDGGRVGGEPPPPVELMDRLVYFHAQMFDDSQMKDELSATWERELPGYVQIELETVEGVWRKWIFEIDWNNGSEARGANGADEDNPDDSGAAQPGDSGAAKRANAPVGEGKALTLPGKKNGGTP